MVGVVRQVNKFLGHFLLEVKLGVNPLQRNYRALQRLELRSFLGRILRKLAVLLADRGAQTFDLFAQVWKLLHIAFPALDFLVENDAIEPFTPLPKLPGKIEMGTRNKAEAVDVLLDHVLGFLNP